MRIIAIKTLREFWQNRQYTDAEQPLKAWIAEARHSSWQTPAEVKAHYRDASVLKGNRIVFNIAGNKYRLITMIHYNSGNIYIRFIGTHKDYDRVDEESV